MAKLAGLSDFRYDPAYGLAFVGEDCVLASLIAACLDADTSLEKLPDHNSSLPEVCNNSEEVVRAAGWTGFRYIFFVGPDKQEWPVVNRRQALVFMATLDNFPEAERVTSYKLLCAAMDDNSADADADLETMRQVIGWIQSSSDVRFRFDTLMYRQARVLQSGWDLGHLHGVTGGSYLEAHRSYPGSQFPIATSSATAVRFKPMPEMLYNQLEYRARYTCAVTEFLEGLTQGVSAQSLPITCFLVACAQIPRGICLYRHLRGVVQKSLCACIPQIAYTFHVANMHLPMQTQ